MASMTIEFKKIYEHDMDLLILEEFVSDRGFARLILDKLSLPDDYVICKAVHSYADSDGESDIMLILQYPDRKIAILIEDKIDAQTMPEQSERYHIRARNAELRGEYDSHCVILAAPEEYHREHLNDLNARYEYRITYEEMQAYFQSQNHTRAMVKAAMIGFALQEKKAGYQVREVKPVTEFWSKLRQYCKKNYPKLVMVGENAPKGASAVWPEFRTSLRTIKVVYKSQKGWVDLEFPRYGDRIDDLRSILKGRITDGMQVWPAGKSASVRIADERWIVNFSRDFEQYQPVIDEVLRSVSILCDMASTLNYSELY